MAESRLEREKRLATEMNIPYVEEDLYVKSLQKETYLMRLDSPLLTVRISKQRTNPRHSKSTKQNSKGVRSKVPPRQMSLLKHL